MPIVRRGGVKVVIYDNRISAHFDRGGEAGRDGVKVGTAALRFARAYAGERSGELKRLLTVGYGKRGPYLFGVNMVSNAPYSRFVNDGTTGPIVGRRPVLRDPKTGKILSGGMPLPAYGRFPAMIVPSVSGQYPKRFLERGMASGLKSAGYPGSQAVFG